jgi:tetratricopeptide (TPR) repeat protein
MNGAERYFRDALRRRPDYGEAANNLALVLVSTQQADAAIALLEDALRRTPAYETGYITLAKIYASVGRLPAAIATLDRLLQRNPAHAAARDLLRQWKLQ